MRLARLPDRRLDWQYSHWSVRFAVTCATKAVFEIYSFVKLVEPTMASLSCKHKRVLQYVMAMHWNAKSTLLHGPVQLRKTERVLKTAIFEASEVRVPTCFIIVNERIDPPNHSSSVEEARLIDEDSSSNKRKSWVQKLANIGDSMSTKASAKQTATNTDLGKNIKELFYKELAF